MAFKFNPVVNLGEILSIVTMIAVVGAYFLNGQLQQDKRIDKTETRVAIIENNQAIMQKSMLRLEERNGKQFESIQSHLIRIEEKLDKKADK